VMSKILRQFNHMLVFVDGTKCRFPISWSQLRLTNSPLQAVLGSYIWSAFISMVREASQVHGMIIKTELYLDQVVKEALISTYAYIGDISVARRCLRKSAQLATEASGLPSYLGSVSIAWKDQFNS
jgi:hypothetical protein